MFIILQNLLVRIMNTITSVIIGSVVSSVNLVWKNKLAMSIVDLDIAQKLELINIHKY